MEILDHNKFVVVKGKRISKRNICKAIYLQWWITSSDGCVAQFSGKYRKSWI